MGGESTGMISTLQDFARSRGPQLLGICNTDYPRIAECVNEAQQRLINIGSETGWWGGWAQVVFNVTRTDPYITLPSQFARIIHLATCRTALQVRNQWFEFLYAGIGLQKPCGNTCGSALEAFERGIWYTAYDLTPTNQKLRLYITDIRDAGKRIFFSGAKDVNGHGVYSQNGQTQALGLFLNFTQPFTTSDFVVTSFDAVMKDQTYGDVILFQVDATTGAEVFLARYTPEETAPTYRRYYIQNLPCGCCVSGEPVTPAQVTCMAKYEYRPAYAPTDMLTIGNIPALIQECCSLRHESIDNPTSRALAEVEHRKAIKLLNAELDHYMGRDNPAINVAPFGTAGLAKQRIGYVW